jgi:hypothetical protein
VTRYELEKRLAEFDPLAYDPSFAGRQTDEVYMQRLEAMGSPLNLPYNEVVRRFIVRYSEQNRKEMSRILGLCYSGQGSYSGARTAFLNAAETDRTKGEPYLQLAQAYAKSSRSIDDGMGGRSAYWAAVDELRHAKQVEPTVEIISFADKLISSYSSYFPKKNDAFMLDLIDGHSYTVPGWIGRSTIIRTR